MKMRDSILTIGPSNLDELKEGINSICRECIKFSDGDDSVFCFRDSDCKQRVYRDAQVTNFNPKHLLDFIAALKTCGCLDFNSNYIFVELISYIQLRNKAQHNRLTKVKLLEIMTIDNNTFDKHLFDYKLPVKCFIGLVKSGFLTISELLLMLYINGININGLNKEIKMLKETIIEYYNL